MNNTSERISVDEYKNIVSGAPDARRQLIGAQSRAAGEAFERMVIAACELYKNRGVAYIEKTPEPMRVLAALDRKHGIFKAAFTKRAQPDFKGTLAAAGRAVCFEAKHTDAGQIKQDAVTAEQADALELHSRLGAMCFVIVSLGMQNFYKVPWAHWKNMRERFGHKYMNAADLAPYRIKNVGGNILFLSGMEDGQ